jgi:hypothetical protein
MRDKPVWQTLISELTEDQKKIMHHWANEVIKNKEKMGTGLIGGHGPDVPEKPPVENDYPYMWKQVIKDMKKRDKMGVEKHKVHLQPFNGRNSLWDAYQELLDLIVYLRTYIYEQEHKKKKGKKHGRS